MFITIFLPVIKLALLVVAGYILRKKEIFTNSGRKVITNVLMSFIIPCVICKSFWSAEITTETIMQCIWVLVFSFVLFALAILVGRVFFRTGDDKKDPVLQYNILLSNTNFLGNPLINAIFGSTGILFWSIFMIPYRVFMYTYGVALYTEPKKETFVKDLLLNPCVICTIFGLIVMFTPLDMPKFLIDTVGYGSNTITGLTMLVIGGVLAEANFKDLFSRWSVEFTAFRLILLPLIMCGICYLFRARLDVVSAGVLVVLAGTPCATMGALFAEKYEKDTKLCAQCFLMSTVLCVATLPMFVLLVQFLWGALPV